MTEKLRIDLQLLLPQVPDAADACVQRLIDELQGRIGIEQVHLRTASDTSAGGTPAQLCIHYDQDHIGLARIREVVSAAGAAISERYGHALWEVIGIGHQRRARTVTEWLQALPGVLEAEAGAAGLVHVEYDRQQVSEQQILSRLAAVHVFPARTTGTAAPADSAESKHAHHHADANKPTDAHAHDHSDHAPHEHAQPHAHNHAHAGLLGANSELVFALLCGGFLLSGWLLPKVFAVPDWLPLACHLAAYGFGGAYTVREAIDNLRLRRFEIDTLMLVAAAGAAALGAWAEGALLLFLFSLGHALEHYAMGRARRAIEALAELAPDTAQVRREGQLQQIPVEQLQVGDVVLVKPNERLPADGFLVLGHSSVNQAPVTGESIPVDKRPVADAASARARPDAVPASSRVFAGTINGNAAIEVEVSRRASESALARVVQMVSAAETRKSPTQRFTDRFERIFVPAVLLLATLLLFAWVVVDEPFRDSFYRAMAVLVAASPCALAIATPSAALAGIARAARAGVLIKGGAPLEDLGSLDAMAFDKTGTLTAGRPHITDIIAVDGSSEAELLAVAVAVESLSDHPLAAAISADGRARLAAHPLPEASGLENLVGRGVTARVNGETVWIGKAELFGSDGIAALGSAAAAAIAQLREAGRTTMAVRHGQRDLGVIGLLDSPREGASQALRELRQLGIQRMVMISGDHQRVATAIATEVGLDQAWGDLMPEHKVDAIRTLRAQGKVAMVGDGVNDAPAMAHATVGIAMGAAGSDVALETADIALMADDLRRLPFAVGLSRRTRKVIRQNLWVSLGIVAVLVPATIFGLGIGPAVAIHEGSTLLVVFNALRLLAHGDEQATLT